MKKSILIVGGGVLGVTLAWYLSHHSQLKVQLLEQNDLLSGASQHSFAWLNSAFVSTAAYTQLRLEALAYWRSLHQQIPALAIDWCGAISWQQSPEQTAAYIETLKTYSFAVQGLTTQQIAKIEPNLKNHS